MSGRIVDASGAAWPITGHRCAVCRLPLDRVSADVGTHPGCEEDREVLRDAALARRIRHLELIVGASAIRSNTKGTTQPEGEKR